MAKKMKNVTPNLNENIVEGISEDFDRFESWVIENGKYLIAGCVILVLAIAVFFSIQAMRASAAKADAQMYAAAKTAEEILAALKSAPSSPAATDARFRLAAIYLGKKDYAAAQNQLELIAKNTDNEFLSKKATLDLGYLYELTGKNADALRVFTTIADNAQTVSDLRAEAAYAAGRIYFEQKNYASARTYLSRFRPNRQTAAGMWGTYANALLRRLPAVTETPAASAVKK